MNKRLFIICLSVALLTSCGMSPEKIAQSLSQLDSSYNSGEYTQAKETCIKLDKVYKKMSDEQKNKFFELRPLVDNAIANISAIQEGINNAQIFYDKKMYYESQAELDKLKEFQLPPLEKSKIDKLQETVYTAIKIWKITEGLQKIEATYNSGDYDLALNLITEIDISNSIEEQKQLYVSLKGKIDNSRALVQAENEYNNGKYSTSLNTLSNIDTTYLSETQLNKFKSLKNNATTAKKKAENTISESQAKQLALNRYSKKGCQSVQCYAQDDRYYYIRLFMTPSYSFVLGECTVDKKNGQILEIPF